MSIYVRLLGPVELRVEGGVVNLGPAKRRALLAALAMEANRPIRLTRLTSLLWTDPPPSSAVPNIRNHIMVLRRLLAGRIDARYRAYQLLLAAEELDVNEFLRRANDGRRALRAGDPARAESELAAALRLWRGPVGEDLTAGVELEARLHGLEEHRLQVVEDLVDARLELDHTGDLVPLLREHLAAHALRERAWAQLMLALYRAGDPSGALATYRQAHDLLGARLGVAPGPELADLHRAMLRRAPWLDRTGAIR
ncbi:hypothetical protein ACTI_28330 [Actinoplanes sp. OR16]|uniref:AfsR/SARP family transcriptional regulator n=1 Tax=Actinoplanes sp. OR16 TaxID=946334 RepID=UPI000F71AAA2|nr:AfsR/SARP family transcriptional regulator [Actinoplanes sp. OR16]BBH66148.1 hypothetical protein ACTI_28330 [Actinoplanes sp. OR16]